MSTTTTTPIPMDVGGRIADQGFWKNQSVDIPDLPFDGRTDFAAMEDLQRSAMQGAVRFGIRNVRAATLAVFIGSAQALADNEMSRPVASFDRIRDVAGIRSLKTSYAVADFIEPILLTWNRPARRIRQAAKRFSEETHADF